MTVKIINAITVSINYLDHKLWSVKYLSIGQRKSGQAFWFVRHVGQTGIIKGICVGTALKISLERGIPYFSEVRHGDPITDSQKKCLKKYGVAVK